MARIDFAQDVGVPLGIGVADVLLAWWDENRLSTNPTAIQTEPIFGPVAALAGYGMVVGNFWPDTGKVIAHAALPLGIRSVWAWARQQQFFGGAGRRIRQSAPVMSAPAPATRGISYGYPAPPQKPEFGRTPAY